MDIRQILEFLCELGKNNNREWMEANKDWLKEVRTGFEGLVNHLIAEIATFDPSVQGLTPKDCIFRLNRDIRFSSNKSPYKTHFGAYIAEGGRKSESAGYYVHLQPDNNSMLGGGMYMPSGEAVKKIRQEVDYNASELKRIVSEPSFREYFGRIQGDELKTAPKGYPVDHPNIDFLRLKNYFVLYNVSDDEATSPEFLPKSASVFRAMQPFNDFLNIAVS
jgi:uncharacterized protein (TIGR02453 family)